MAEFCGLTVKQTRVAFAKLQRLQFAAYRRAGRYTLISVLNYGTYQDSASDEGQGKEQGKGQDEGRMRAPIEEREERKEHTRASDDALPSVLPSIDESPFETTEPDGLFPGGEPPKRKPASPTATFWNR